MFKGRNTYIVVEPCERDSSSQDSIVLLPDDYKVDNDVYSVAVIKECGSVREEGDYEQGDKIVFPTHLLQEFVFKGETTYLVLESHILCSMKGD